MFPGQLTLCLKTKDLPGMRRFYEALGMKVHIEEPNFVLLNNGDEHQGVLHDAKHVLTRHPAVRGLAAG